MKFILFIFTFVSIACNGQVTITNVAGSFTTLGVGLTTGLTMTAGKLYIIFAGTSNNAGTVATIGISGTGQTWTEIGTAGGATNTTSKKRIQAFRFAPTSNNTNDIIYTYTGTQDGGWVQIYEITGCDVSGTNGSNAITQSAGGFSNSANPSTIFGSIQPNASIILALINDVNPFTGAPESGWTESVDGGYATPDTGGYVMYRIGTTDNSPTVTAASSGWASIAIELKPSSGRRRIRNTN